MTRPAFVAPQADTFSLANIDVDGVARDWSKGWAEDWEPVLPTITIATLLERAPDLIDDRDDAQALRADPAQGLDADLRDAFQQHEGRDGWADSFMPMMDHAWPVELAYDVDAQTAADLIDIHAGSVALVRRGLDVGDDDFEIVMTGGGTDMTADLAIAYLCCGCVPPLKLLIRLGEVGEGFKLSRFPLGAVYERAAEWLDARRADLATQMQRLFEQR